VTSSFIWLGKVSAW